MRLLISILVLIGVSSLAGSFGLLLGEPMYVAPSLQKLDPGVAHWALVVMAFTYSMSAWVAAYASWSRSLWALGAYAAFAGSAILFAAFFLYIAPIPVDAFSFIAGPIFFGVVGWGLWKGRQVLATELQRVQRAA